jgi:hypothetical protein
MMRKLPVLRASATERWMNCTWFSSHEWPEGESSEAAERGRRVHAGIAQHFGAAKDESGPKDADERLMVQVGIDYAEELVQSAGPGWKVLVEKKMTTDLFDTQVETFTGTMDFVLVNEAARRAVLVDWKTGQRHSGYEPQMLTYAWLLNGHHDADHVDVRLVYLASGEEDQMSISLEAIRAHSEAMMVASSRRSEEQPKATPGHWCTWCPGAMSCPKNTAIVDAVTEASLLKVDLAKLATSVDTDAEAQAAHAIVNYATELVAKIESNLKAHVRQAGPLTTREGQKYSVSSGERTTLNVTPEIAGIIEEAGAGACLKTTATWSDIKKKLAKNAVALENLEAALREAGAMNTTTFERWTTK